MKNIYLKSPYPYFGGKSRVAPLIWEGLGSVEHYIEPFAGSLAVLLANPKVPKMETINDKDCFIVNFWRSLVNNTDDLIKFIQYPVTETDLHARHRWLIEQGTQEFINKLETDPNYFDVKIAGWWVWGLSASIGNNWLQPKGLKSLPIISYAGAGVHGTSLPIKEWLLSLQERTKKVRICCGDWKRIVSPAITINNGGLSKEGITGIFLDPPYQIKGRDKVYKKELNIYEEVCQWAIENGNHPKLRIVVCGYEGFTFPENWSCIAWKANGGMANLGKGRGKDNASRERIYFSPYCIPTTKKE